MAAQVYISGDRVGIDIDHEDITDAFKKFGRLGNVWVARQPPGFAFVEFEDSRDAEDAIEDLDGREVRGCRLRVEHSRRKGGGKGGKGGGDRMGNREFQSRAPQRTEYRVRCSGLPPSTNWRDLKDFLREGGEITYADVGQDGVGVAEFTTRRDMEECIDRLDNSRFRGERVTIEKETRTYDFRQGGYKGSGGGRDGGGDRSGDRRGREPSRSRSRSRSRSHERDGDRGGDRGGDRDADRRNNDDDDRRTGRDRDARRNDDDREDRRRSRDDDDSRGRDRRRDDDDRNDDRDRDRRRD